MKIISRIETIRAREHEATVALITALVECDRERAHIALGHSSMWDFLTRHLHYSNAAASRRCKAMKCARQFPRVLDMLRKHETNLSALAAAEATLMRAGDAEELLGKIANKSQAQVEQELARQNPKPKIRETVRRFAATPPVQPEPTPDLFNLCAPSSAAEVRTSETRPKSTDVPPTSAPEVPEPEDRVQLGFSVTAATYDKFERAKALLSGKHPKGLSLEAAFEELVDSFLETKTRVPKARQAKPKSTNKTTRHIPAATRRAVMKRDGGKCTYVGPTGTRCNSTHDIELDHIQPWSANGSHDADNLRVLCATHNRHRNLEVRERAPRDSTTPMDPRQGTSILNASGGHRGGERRFPRSSVAERHSPCEDVVAGAHSYEVHSAGHSLSGVVSAIPSHDVAAGTLRAALQSSNASTA